MHATQKMLWEVWSLVSRQPDLDICLKGILPVLAKQIPVSHMLVRTIDRDENRLTTLAEASLQEKETFFPGWTNLSELHFAELDAVFAEKQLHPEAKHFLFPDTGGFRTNHPTGKHVLMGALNHSGKRNGLVFFLYEKGTYFPARHDTLLQALLEPLGAALDNSLRNHELITLQNAAEAERQALLKRLGRAKLTNTIVGANGGLRHAMERVEMVSQSSVPVLILGETGSGKEVIAREIHHRSLRKDRAFLRVNCGAIAPELIDSELFGHEKGAFTGAAASRRGWFERADGGTLFLDEIGDLPPAAQVRLLRVLQDGWLERVGGEHSVHVDVRVIAATHCDLREMITQKRFREDLWYRLCVFPVLLPPLRDRPEDIPELADFFIARAASRFGVRQIMPTPQDIAILKSYSWPGNVREFASVIDRAAILGNGRSLEIANALGAVFSLNHPVLPASLAGKCSEIRPLDEVIKGHIEMALESTQGIVEGPFGCARLLGVNPHTLRGKMRKHGIAWGKIRQRFSQERAVEGNKDSDDATEC